MHTLLRRLLVAFTLLPMSAGAQIQDLGSEATLDVATWNIEWFGHSSNGPSNVDTQVANVLDIINGSGIDLWAVQEIANPDRFDELLSLLPTYWRGELASVSGQQRIGYLWDTRVLTLRLSTHILTSQSTAFAGRPPLKAEFTVTLPDTSFVVTFINVHMKAFADLSSYNRRVDAAKRIKNHIDFTSLASEPVVFLGDFNDEMEASTYNAQPSPYVPFIEDTADYSVLTLPLEAAGGASFQSGSFLDHIVVTNEMTDLWLEGSTRVATSLVSVNSFYARTSDHLPVVASFGPSTVTSSEEALTPDRALLSDPWPNPAMGPVSVEYSGTDRNARIQVVDALGRVISDQMVSRGINRIDVPRGATGLFFIRLLGPEGAHTRPLLLVGN
ncbi:MAG: endonuclease/exonuclease/phosphatase family protein [Bacteroidota bacterium]|nr:endonuclease/exonuclease/phosphatase family protein [Bacteroidota bacterium]